MSGFSLKNDREALASSRFSCTERERAVFEAGIKMATIYHQFVGTPVNRGSVSVLEKAISESIEVQPYVLSADVSIDRSSIPSGKDMYSYTSLTGDMIDAVVKIGLGGYEVTAEMRYDRELKYPLMFVSSVEERQHGE
ncbi:MAG: dihydroneopterin aldolase family protein [Candidatus Methanomethylophilaceae archaeon]|nr:dihydroneopterin aldolase family protein [Candidatus Methanomethylophilaceae archaeon]